MIRVNSGSIAAPGVLPFIVVGGGESGQALAPPVWAGYNTMRVKRMERQFDVIIERDEDGFYVASVPSLPGCHTLMTLWRESVRQCPSAWKSRGRLRRPWNSSVSNGSQSPHDRGRHIPIDSCPFTAHPLCGLAGLSGKHSSLYRNPPLLPVRCLLPLVIVKVERERDDSDCGRAYILRTFRSQSTESSGLNSTRTGSSGSVTSVCKGLPVSFSTPDDTLFLK